MAAGADPQEDEDDASPTGICRCSRPTDFVAYPECLYAKLQAKLAIKYEKVQLSEALPQTQLSPAPSISGSAPGLQYKLECYTSYIGFSAWLTTRATVI